MSRQFDGVDDILTVAHGTELNLTAWTVAFWIKRTSAGEGDYRICGKAAGTAAGCLQATGQSGDVTMLRGRQAAGGGSHYVAISATGIIPASSWKCRFVTYAAGPGPIAIYEYDGVDVQEVSYSSAPGGAAAIALNSDPLYIGNTSDGSNTLGGLLAFLAIDNTVWNNAKMLEFAEGALPADTNFFWRMDEAGASIPNSGTISGYAATVSGAILSVDDPPELYSSYVPPEGPIALESGGPMLLESAGSYLLDP